MFENPVVKEIDSLVRQCISEGSLDKAIGFLSKFSELQDLVARKFPINHDLLQAYIRGDSWAIELFQKREDFMRQCYIRDILPHFKLYLTKPE